MQFIRNHKKIYGLQNDRFHLKKSNNFFIYKKICSTLRDVRLFHFLNLAFRPAKHLWALLSQETSDLPSFAFFPGPKPDDVALLRAEQRCWPCRIGDARVCERVLSPINLCPKFSSINFGIFRLWRKNSFDCGYFNIANFKYLLRENVYSYRESQLKIYDSMLTALF